MVYFLNQKKVQTNEDSYTPPSSLVLPVPVKQKQKYLRVSLSIGTKTRWANVDFSNTDYDGIYTDGLTSCCALAIIKIDTDGNIGKAWMIHLAGGFNPHQMPDLPEPWDNRQFKMLGLYGSSHPADSFYEGKERGDEENIINRYKGTGLTSDDIAFFTCAYSRDFSSSLAISKDGCIGLKPESLARSNKLRKGKAQSRQLDRPHYDKEIRCQKFLIEMSPADQKGLEKIYDQIKQQTVDLTDPHEFTSHELAHFQWF